MNNFVVGQLITGRWGCGRLCVMFGVLLVVWGNTAVRGNAPAYGVEL